MDLLRPGFHALKDHIEHLSEGCLGCGLIDLTAAHEENIVACPHSLRKHSASSTIRYMLPVGKDGRRHAMGAIARDMDRTLAKASVKDTIWQKQMHDYT